MILTCFVDNIEPKTLTTLAKAAAHVTVELVKNGKKLIPKWTPVKARKRHEKTDWTHTTIFGKHSHI